MLLRLLSAGKTLVGMGDNNRSYRLPQAGAMPRFKSKKNPFRATTRPEGARKSEEPGPEQAEAPVAPAVQNEPVSRPEPVPVSAPAAATARPVAPKSERMADLSGRLGSWLKGLKGSLRRKGVTEVERPSVQGNTRPAQGELRLEMVQVVRNDLSETDIEIVPREAARKSFVERVPGVMAASQARAAADTAWSRVSTRIFGSGNVR